MRLILIRHGTTEWNRERRIQGWLDSPLTPEAIRQIEQMALPKMQSPLVFSSDLDRAHKSAQIIADRLGVSVMVDQRLKERGFGILEAEIIDKCPQLHEQWSDYHQRYIKPMRSDYGVESELEFESRARGFLSQLNQYSNDSDIVIVSHGEYLRVIANLIRGIESWHCGSGIIQNAQPVEMVWHSDVLIQT